MSTANKATLLLQEAEMLAKVRGNSKAAGMHIMMPRCNVKLVLVQRLTNVIMHHSLYSGQRTCCNM